MCQKTYNKKDQFHKDESDVTKLHFTNDNKNIVIYHNFACSEIIVKADPFSNFHRKF